MARIKYTALVESIRGSIAGTTFQRNAYGYTVKAKPNMVNPNTNSQSSRKAGFQRAQQLWLTLSVAERAAWDTYAATFPVPTHNNPAAYLSGFNLFVRWHAIESLQSTTVLNNPSGAQGTLTFDTFELTAVAPPLEAVITTSLVTEAWDTFLFLSRPLKPTQQFNRSFTRFIDSAVVAAPTVMDIEDEYEEIFGLLPDPTDSIAVEITFKRTTNGQVIYIPPFTIAVL